MAEGGGASGGEADRHKRLNNISCRMSMPISGAAAGFLNLSCIYRFSDLGSDFLTLAVDWFCQPADVFSTPDSTTDLSEEESAI